MDNGLFPLSPDGLETGPAAKPDASRVRHIAGRADLLPLHECWPQRYPHLLETTAQGEVGGGFDILFAFPGASLTLDHGGRLSARPAAGGSLDGLALANGGERFFETFDSWWCTARKATVTPAPLPFTGGWFVFLAYEMAMEEEPHLRLPGHGGFPRALATRFPAAILRDHANQCLWLVAEEGHDDALELMEADLMKTGLMEANRAPWRPAEIVEEPPARYLHAVERAIAYIRAGDIFQANLSRQWRIVLDDLYDRTSLYRALRRHNPGPFSGLATFDDGALLSSSPERLVRVRGRHVESRPIAGTRPRHLRLTSDQALSAELLADPKERAEHIMLVDLERNDLSRVCRPGSVRVSDYMAIESYRHVHHIVSNIEGLLNPEATPGAILRAVFPGGTITGCPKLRCMEIIAELEGTGRGPYTGAMGYVTRAGDMDFNILIRSFAENDGALTLRAGGGIVADSRPPRELAETRHKARGLLAALNPPCP